MTELQIKTLGHIIKECAYQLDIDHRDDYSGRGMYGARCVGIVGSPRDLNTVLKEVIKILAYDMTELMIADPDATPIAFEKAIDELFKYRTDHMGMDMIFYWPNLKGDN